MNWIIFITLTPILYSLVSAISLHESLPSEPEEFTTDLYMHGENFTTKTEGNDTHIIALEAEKSNSSEIRNDRHIIVSEAEKSNSSEKVVTEANESNSSGINSSSLINSGSSFYSLKGSYNEDTPQTTMGEAQSTHKEAPSKREDTEPVNQTAPEAISQQQTSEQSLPQTPTDQLPTASENPSVSTAEVITKAPSKREDTESVNQIAPEATLQQQTSEQALPQTPADQLPTASENPSVSTAEVTTKIPTTTKIPSTKKPKPNKPKPPRVSTVKPLAAESPVTPAATVRPTSVTVEPTKPTSTQRYPCRCADGTCSCCTGIVLENFNVPLRSRACANVTYEPDDFAFNFRLAFNNIVLYNRRMSAKNPRPACIPINRYFGIKMCAKLSNVYMSGRNVHACLDFEGFFDDETAFKYSFNCFRIGSQGVAIVRPEEGGGLPPPPDEEEQVDEDYDDSARAWLRWLRRRRSLRGRRSVRGGRRSKSKVRAMTN